MDSKVIRAGINSAVITLLSGTILGTFGGWSAVYNLAPNLFGIVILASVFSILLCYIFSYWFADFLPGTSLLKGALFGILVWIAFLILGGVSTFFKDAVYASNSGQILFLALINHLIWGAILSIFLESKG